MLKWFKLHSSNSIEYEVLFNTLKLFSFLIGIWVFLSSVIFNIPGSNFCYIPFLIKPYIKGLFSKFNSGSFSLFIVVVITEYELFINIFIVYLIIIVNIKK